jgi:hypothetical protein
LLGANRRGKAWKPSQGFHISDSDATNVLSQMSSFDLLDTGGMDLAVESARNYRRLRARPYGQEDH